MRLRRYDKYFTEIKTMVHTASNASKPTFKGCKENCQVSKTVLCTLYKVDNTNIFSLSESYLKVSNMLFCPGQSVDPIYIEKHLALQVIVRLVP